MSLKNKKKYQLSWAGCAMTRCLAHFDSTHLSPSNLWVGLDNDPSVDSTHFNLSKFISAYLFATPYLRPNFNKKNPSELNQNKTLHDVTTQFLL